MAIDKIDLQIICALQKNADQRLEDVAGMVKLATSSVHERVRRLERDGIIRRWTVEVDAAALGLGVLAYVGLRTSTACADALVELKQIPAIEECHSVAGELCFLLKIRVATTSDLMDLLERLRTLPGVEGTESTIVLKTQFDRPMSLHQSGMLEPERQKAARK